MCEQRVEERERVQEPTGHSKPSSHLDVIPIPINIYVQINLIWGFSCLLEIFMSCINSPAPPGVGGNAVAGMGASGSPWFLQHRGGDLYLSLWVLVPSGTPNNLVLPCPTNPAPSLAQPPDLGCS